MMLGFLAGAAMLGNTFVFPIDASPKAPINNVIELESHFINSNRWGLELSDDDIDLLYRICYHEANNQSDNGVQAVAEVVLNRVSSNKFPNTVKGVLFAPRQFCSEKELRKTPSSERIEEIVNKLVWGESEYVLSPYAMYFQTTPTGSQDEIQIGQHYFRRKY